MPRDTLARDRTQRRPVARFGIVVPLVALVGCAAPVVVDRDVQVPADAARDAQPIGTLDTGAPPDAAPLFDALDAPTVPDGDAPPDAHTTDAHDAGPMPSPTSLLLNGANPMPCADPAVFSETNAGATYYVYCTSMSHVWRTTDWVSFSDARGATMFDLTGLDANGRSIGSWWAPGIVYAPATHEYVMWVSVPAARGTMTSSGWDTRSLAVFTAVTPTGPWTFRRIALTGSTVGQHYIDPFLFLDHDGGHYVFFKTYGGGLTSSIMGVALDASWRDTVGGQVEIMQGYGGTGTWEDNVRENPTIVYEAAGNRHHFLFSGGHWDDDSYATGHALSTCGPLCVDAARGGWHMVSSGDRGIVQVVRSAGDPNFTHGGPGGAVFENDAAQSIVYAAAARSAHGDATRYLMRQAVVSRNGAPYVDTAGHRPAGL